jgi:dsDNA-specific endonuclease/ATPase MutS2
MDLNELWIGDTVKLQSSGKIGTYIGTNSEGRPRVRCGTKVILTAANNIEVFHESEKQGEVDIELIEKPTVKNSAYLSREIDLHIENLNPSLTHEAPQMILNHQIKRCRTYIESIINAQISPVTIVHGKGKGQLKLEVEYLLSQYDEYNYSIPANDGGASQVWFTYS